jgi:hypothetical protein
VNENRIEQGVTFAKMEGRVGPRAMLMGFSQWVGSGKVGRDTGWRDRRMLFSEGIVGYRIYGG